MVLRVILLVVSTADLFGQVNDASMRRIENNLTDVIRWESLWNDTPKSFRTPRDGSAELTVSVTSETISYCSHQLGACAAYKIEASRNWQRLRSAPCDGRETDEEALLAFVGSGGSSASRPNSQQPPVVGPGGLSGAWKVDSPVRWGMTIKLENRSRIVEQYKELHPSEADSLRTWLRTNYRNSGYRSITFACFKPSDPVVYFYGDRRTKGPIVVSLFWDRERENWIEAGMLERTPGLETFDALRSTIQAIACDTIRFN